jgi:hypothetical protein
MMRNIKNILTGGALALAISSCTVTLPVTASRAEIGSLKGKSQSTVLFGIIFLNKDFGLKQAAKNGKITSAIATVDMKTTNYFFFSKRELIVTAK